MVFGMPCATAALGVECVRGKGMNAASDTRNVGRCARQLIYVVDDEPMLLDLARRVLEAEGYEVKTYRDPTAALLAYRRLKRKPVLILTDYHMRTMSGLELTAACRRLNPDVKVALLTGTVDASMLGGLQDPPDGFLRKPYGHRELLRLVRRLLP